MLFRFVALISAAKRSVAEVTVSVMLTLMRPNMHAEVAFLGHDILMSVDFRCTDGFCCFLVTQALLTPHMKQDKLQAAPSDESCICILSFRLFYMFFTLSCLRFLHVFGAYVLGQ